MSDDTKRRSPLDALPTGLRNRTLLTARLATRMGAGFVKRTLTGPGADEADDARAAASAAELVEQLGNLKGLVMKIGQMASYLPGALPPAAQRVLTQLQSSTRPMSFAAVDAIV